METITETDTLRQVIADLLTYQPVRGSQLYADACLAIGRTPPAPNPPYVGGEHPHPPLPARPYGPSRYPSY